MEKWGTAQLQLGMPLQAGVTNSYPRTPCTGPPRARTQLGLEKGAPSWSRAGNGKQTMPHTQQKGGFSIKLALTQSEGSMARTWRDENPLALLGSVRWKCRWHCCRNMWHVTALICPAAHIRRHCPRSRGPGKTYPHVGVPTGCQPQAPCLLWCLARCPEGNPAHASRWDPHTGPLTPAGPAAAQPALPCWGGIGTGSSCSPALCCSRHSAWGPSTSGVPAQGSVRAEHLWCPNARAQPFKAPGACRERRAHRVSNIGCSGGKQGSLIHYCLNNKQNYSWSKLMHIFLQD